MLSHRQAMDRPLDAGHVQRVIVARVGGREVALLQVRVPGETVHVALVAGAGVGVVGKDGRARLRAAMPEATAPGAARAQAIVEAVRAGLAGATREALEQAGARMVEQLARDVVGGRREALRRALARAVARVERRAEAVRGDVARAESADATAQRARLFVAEAARAKRGATRLVTVDWSSGEAREVELPLDPARGAQEQLDALFRRARRLKDGGRIARARLADAETMRAELASVLGVLVALGDEAADLDALERRARAAAPRDFKLAAGGPAAAAARARADAPRAPYRTFLGASGARILVGKGAEKNDAVTFHVGRPQDLWLHAKNRTGAHVIVPLDRGASCPADVLVEAAHLAAHFSDARDETVVEVQYTPRRYLRKPKGSAPGLVVVDREKVIVLRKQDELLRKLLESEPLPPGPPPRKQGGGSVK
jgi:predicted ribosome quality control (RQC) complex YloA/Tae2 family protein